MVSLDVVEARLAELSQSLYVEVDIDVDELEWLQQIIRQSGDQMTADRAIRLKASLDIIEQFVLQQRNKLHKILSSSSSGRKAIGQYGKVGLRSKTKLVYHKA
jgi:hypothetical protein